MSSETFSIAGADIMAGPTSMWVRKNASFSKDNWFQAIQHVPDDGVRRDTPDCRIEKDPVSGAWEAAGWP